MRAAWSGRGPEHPVDILASLVPAQVLAAAEAARAATGEAPAAPEPAPARPGPSRKALRQTACRGRLALLAADDAHARPALEALDAFAAPRAAAAVRAVLGVGPRDDALLAEAAKRARRVRARGGGEA